MVYFLTAHGHFEFVLRRGDKRGCIVEAKKDDMGQGMAQEICLDVKWQQRLVTWI